MWRYRRIGFFCISFAKDHAELTRSWCEYQQNQPLQQLKLNSDNRSNLFVWYVSELQGEFSQKFLQVLVSGKILLEGGWQSHGSSGRVPVAWKVIGTFKFKSKFGRVTELTSRTYNPTMPGKEAAECSRKILRVEFHTV